MIKYNYSGAGVKGLLVDGGRKKNKNEMKEKNLCLFLGVWYTCFLLILNNITRVVKTIKKNKVC